MTFVIPTLNAGALLARCLGSIRAQDYPPDRVEVLVMDGGSSDATLSLAADFQATVVANPLRRAEPGVKLGLRRASHPIRVVLAADNGLPSRDWLRRVAAAFELPGVRGVYTNVVPASSDGVFCRYFNLLHADPFNWYVFGARRVHPARFGEAYPLLHAEAGAAIYELTAGEPPLLAVAQGFAILGDLPVLPAEDEDDIAPVWTLIDGGARLAYVDVGVWHETVRGFHDFLSKYHRRALAGFRGPAPPHRVRAARLAPAQRRRRYLWLPYSLSVVAPAADALLGLARDRDLAWLWHPLACLGLTGAIALATVRERTRMIAARPIWQRL